jgi:hypothetical protein
VSQVFEAEAFAALHRVAAHTGATANALSEASNSLEATDRADLCRQLQKAAELHRLFAARLAAVLRELGAGQ